MSRDYGTWRMASEDNRLSRNPYQFEGSLRGLSAREYHDITGMNPQGLIRAARRFLTEQVWTKLDRRRPMSGSHAQQALCALNSAAMDIVKHYPYIYPDLNARIEFHPAVWNKYTVVFSGLRFKALENIITPNGKICFVSNDILDHRGKKGRIGFSTHAIDRTMERSQTLAMACTLYAKTFVALLMNVVSRKEIYGDMLVSRSVKKTYEHLFGYYPIEYDEENKVWVAKTFLLPKMDGTPEYAIELLKQVQEKFGDLPRKR